MKKILLFLSVLTLISCKKNSTGGQATISCTVLHHTRVIPNATVYIKYGAKEFPGKDPSAYSDHKQADANGHVDFTGLRYGDYYLYGVGYDSSILLPVTGGDHLNIKWSERKKTFDFVVPVTE
jgi:hypothetical protein